MKNYKNISREQLTKSVERRIKHLMVKMLEDFETFFEDIEQTNNGQLFKSQLKTSFNDVIRAQRDELNDYVIEYKPLRKNPDNSLSVTRTFLESLQKIEFGIQPKPFLKVFTKDAYAVINALREEFEVGVIYKTPDSLILEVSGLNDCVSIIPLMDHYVLHANVKDKYGVWREELVNLYKGDR